MLLLKKDQAVTKMELTIVDSVTFMSSTKVSFLCIKSGVAVWSLYCLSGEQWSVAELRAESC